MRAFLTKHRYDIIVFLSLLVLGLSVLLITLKLSPTGECIKITDTSGGTVYLSLNEDRVYTLPDGKNTVVIEDGKAYMRDADCPDSLCIRMGKINSVGERIICLPNKVIVEVIYENESP